MVVEANGAVPAEEQAVRDANRAAEGAAGETTASSDLLTLTSGIEIKLKPVSGLLLQRAVAQVPKPTVPTWRNDERGRDEPNPSDPDYVAAMERYEETTALAAMNAMYLMGIDILEVPAGVQRSDDEIWVEELEFLGIDVRTEGRGRYLDWLKYVALADPRDLISVSNGVGRMSGLQEIDVMGAVDSFRRAERRGTDSELSAADVGDGDRVQPDLAAVGDGD